MAEHGSHKPLVVGSNPTVPTKFALWSGNQIVKLTRFGESLDQTAGHPSCFRSMDMTAGFYPANVGSIPASSVTFSPMGELADPASLSLAAVKRAGSNPAWATIFKRPQWKRRIHRRTPETSRAINGGDKLWLLNNFNHTASGQLLSRAQTARGTVVHSATPKNVTGDLKTRVQTLLGISIVRACVVNSFN